MFQSSPSPKTGRYQLKQIKLFLVIVPILTQSEDWALRIGKTSLSPKNGSNPHPVRRLGATSRISRNIPKRKRLFQSSPSPKTGRYLVLVSDCGADWLFQSSPSPKTGRYPVECPHQWRKNGSSNPHPVRRLGATKRSA